MLHNKLKTNRYSGEVKLTTSLSRAFALTIKRPDFIDRINMLPTLLENVLFSFKKPVIKHRGRKAFDINDWL